MGCGASLLSSSLEDSEQQQRQWSNGDTNQGYYWQHIFSNMMDASIPTIDHVIEYPLDSSSVVDITTASTIDGSKSNGTTTIAFRMFAFLPYGKGIFLSRTYAFNLKNGTMYTLDFNDGYSGPLPKLSSPSFMMGAEFMSIPTAFGQGPCYESIDLTAGDSSVIVIGGDESEGACVCQVESSGFKRRTRSLMQEDDDLVCNEFSAPLVQYSLSEGVVSFQLDLEGNETVASSFYYGLDPSSTSDGGSADYSYDAFYDTDGKNETNTLHHGIVRADTISADPSALAPLSVLSIDENNLADGSLVVGGVWVDTHYNVHYSRETRIPLSEVVKYMPTKQPTKPPSVVDSNSLSTKESSLCPKGSLRNIASASQGAFILDVSSSYSEAFIASNAIDEDPSTQWSSKGDGDDAYITIQLPFPSNIVYVDFYTRTMGTSAQIVEYQIEAGNVFDNLEIAAESCVLPDASKSYECGLDLSDENDPQSGGMRNVTLVNFRVTASSGGNTGAVDLSVYGCSVADLELMAELNGDSDLEDSVVAEDVVNIMSESESVDSEPSVDAPKAVADIISNGLRTKLPNVFLSAVIYIVCMIKSLL